MIRLLIVQTPLVKVSVLGLHIDNGFMRKNESAQVAEAYRKFGFTNFIVEDASESFLKAITGLTDPQKKRMAVGENFINVRNEVSYINVALPTERIQMDYCRFLSANQAI